MNQALVDGINKNVKFNDVLIHLGDWSFGGIDKIWEFRKQINCQNIYHVYGNHDHHISRNKVLPNCHKDVLGTIVDGSVDGNVVYAKDLFDYTSKYS
jgi:predicted phosphodiesterase